MGSCSSLFLAEETGGLGSHHFRKKIVFILKYLQVLFINPAVVGTIKSQPFSVYFITTFFHNFFHEVHIHIFYLLYSSS